jgi:hypothetical protein
MTVQAHDTPGSGLGRMRHSTAMGPMTPAAGDGPEQATGRSGTTARGRPGAPAA